MKLEPVEFQKIEDYDFRYHFTTKYFTTAESKVFWKLFDDMMIPLWDACGSIEGSPKFLTLEEIRRGA